MSEIKLRVYAVSLMAFSPLHDTSVPGESTYIEHIPALIPAESIQAAAEAARQHALGKWKVEEGWYSHQAAITPVTKAFFDAASGALHAGVIDMYDEGEQGQVFQF